MNRARMANDTLNKLAESKDRRTAIFARTTLLGSGDRKQIGFLRTPGEHDDVPLYQRTADKGFFVTGPTPGRGACYGDSGGPVYVTWENRWYAIGATNGRSGGNRFFKNSRHVFYLTF